MADVNTLAGAATQVAGKVAGAVFKAFPANPLTGGACSDTMSEWSPSYAPRYPYNHVRASTSGHIEEIDDTPGAERIHYHHRTGTHIEMRPDGSIKIKAAKHRQDCTTGDQEIMVKGDFKITAEGNIKIYAVGGELSVQCDNGAAFNVKGQLKLISDDGITLKAKNKISLQAPFVDIGDGLIPYMSYPGSVAELMGVVLGQYTGLSIPGVQNIPLPAAPTGSSGGSVTIGQLKTAFDAIRKVSSALNTFGQYKNSATMGLSLLKRAAAGRGGTPIIPEIEQPDELPLANPLLYNPGTPEKILLRDRQFDSPDDVEDTTTYLAHLKLMDTLKDMTPDHKVLPGQLDEQFSDETPPEAEPDLPVNFFLESGTVSCVYGSPVVTGSGTKFSEELVVGQGVAISFGAERPRTFKIVSIESDTSLVLDDPWDRADITGTRMGVMMLRPFAEFFEKSDFTLQTPLGSSGLVLGDLMKNYIAPTIEKIPANLLIAQPNKAGIDESANGTPGTPTDLSGTTRDGQYVNPVPASEQRE